MYLLLPKFRVLEFRLLMGRVSPYLQFVTTNYLINWSGLEPMFRKDIGGEYALILKKFVDPYYKDFHDLCGSVFTLTSLLCFDYWNSVMCS